MNEDRIVAGGRERLLKDPANQKRLDGAVRAIRTRYAPQMKDVGLIARTRLWFRMHKEIRAAIEAIAPSRGCYIKH